MEFEGINVEDAPRLKNPVFIVGFDGWGNALNTSKGMVDYIIRTLRGRFIAQLDTDMFYRYDAVRPIVAVEDGVLKKHRPPGASFFAIETESDAHDLVVLSGDEPNLAWSLLVRNLYGYLQALGVKTVISLGGLFDNVLHTDRVISGVVSNEGLKALLRQKGVSPITYHGPSTIHATIQWEGRKRGFECLNLWCHCPYYLQGLTHFGLLSTLGRLLSYLGHFNIDMDVLEDNWERLQPEIQELIEKNPQIKSAVERLMKQRSREAAALHKSVDPKEKIIDLSDFLEPK
ncbi:MAG: PAC2 family protein [Desulfobacterales bacterium]